MTAFVEYNPTMATASMTIASHSIDHNSSVLSSVDHYVESREESIEKLKLNLVRYARSNDRRMILRSLKDVTFLSYIPLELPTIPSDVSIRELEKEASMETVVINDTVLSPADTKKCDLRMFGANNGCAAILKGFAKVLCRNSALNEKLMYERVLVRLSKSSVSADIYSQLNSMMGSAELIVKNLPSDYTIKSNAAIVSRNKSNNRGGGDPYYDLKLYNTGGQIHMVVESTLNYGLFRKSDMNVNRPWIVMKCNVYERANLSTNEGFRSLCVQTPNLY